MTADFGGCSKLILLDLSAEYDTIDHSILRQTKIKGIAETALDWFSSYLANRIFFLFVSVGEFTSRTAQTKHGIPQRSISGHVLFTLYMLRLG